MIPQLSSVSRSGQISRPAPPLQPLPAGGSTSADVTQTPAATSATADFDGRISLFLPAVQLEEPGEEPGCCELTECLCRCRCCSRSQPARARPPSLVAKVLSHDLTSVQLLCEVSPRRSPHPPASGGEEGTLRSPAGSHERPNEPINVCCAVSDCQRLLGMNDFTLMHRLFFFLLPFGPPFHLCATVSSSRRDKNRSGTAFSLMPIDKQKRCILLIKEKSAKPSPGVFFSCLFTVTFWNVLH